MVQQHKNTAGMSNEHLTAESPASPASMHCRTFTPLSNCSTTYLCPLSQGNLLSWSTTSQQNRDGKKTHLCQATNRPSAQAVTTSHNKCKEGNTEWIQQPDRPCLSQQQDSLSIQTHISRPLYNLSCKLHRKQQSHGGPFRHEENRKQQQQRRTPQTLREKELFDSQDLKATLTFSCSSGQQSGQQPCHEIISRLISISSPGILEEAVRRYHSRVSTTSCYRKLGR